MKKYIIINIVLVMFLLVLFWFNSNASALNKISNEEVEPYNKYKNNNQVYKQTISYENVLKHKNSKVRTAKTPVRFNLTLDVSIPKVGANKAHSLNFKGKDVYVAVIDSGIENSHEFFQNRIALEACFSERCPNGESSMIGSGAAKPVHWHGTHVAGIIAGANSRYLGVAPEAKIIAINVFDTTGGAYDEDIIKALEWIKTLVPQYNIASVNMSLGTSSIFRNTCDNFIPEMTQAIKDLKDANVATVVAAGNSYSVGMSAPACISHSVSVAATSSWTDKVTSFSNISEYTTFAAPGLSVTSSKANNTYGASSGTSMSAPHIAGAFAVYRSKYGNQTVNKTVFDFQSTAVPALDEYSKIYAKRLDFTKMFTGQDPVVSPTTSTTSTTTTIKPITTTTTVPVVSTTFVAPVVTTTTVPNGTKFISAPSINRIRQLSIDSYGITFRYYVYQSNKPVYLILNCQNDLYSPVAYQNSFVYTGGNLLNYVFNTQQPIKYCKAVAVDANNNHSMYSVLETITN